MSALPQARRLRPREYLMIERAAEDKSECYRGIVYAMSGGSPMNSLVAANLTIALGRRLQGGRCRVFDSNLMVGVTSWGSFFYPDLTVVCGPLETYDDSNDVVTNPTVVIEILSPSTQTYDQGLKFEEYKAIPSLQAVLFLSVEERFAVVWHRGPEGAWTEGPRQTEEGVLSIPSLEVEVPLSEAFAGVGD